MRIVIALGGNALLRRGEPMDATIQRRNVGAAADAIAAIARDHDVIVTHGNGPQVGLLALQAAAYRDVAPYPLDMLVAESEGLIGYLLQQALADRLPGRRIATLLTQVEVHAGDPAFTAPEKLIGPIYDETAARRLGTEHGWTVMQDGAGFRRVVPSPVPQRIIELPTIRQLADAGVLVICAGGGGIPVVAEEGGAFRGVEAVVDKDMSATLLAEGLNADHLLLLTDAPAVYLDWPQPGRQAIRSASPSALSPERFAAGSMRPKVRAACRFAMRTGGVAAIGALENAASVLAGTAGTTISTGIGTLALYPAA